MPVHSNLAISHPKQALQLTQPYFAWTKHEQDAAELLSSGTVLC